METNNDWEVVSNTIDKEKDTVDNSGWETVGDVQTPADTTEPIVPKDKLYDTEVSNIEKAYNINVDLINNSEMYKDTDPATKELLIGKLEQKKLEALQKADDGYSQRVKVDKAAPDVSKGVNVQEQPLDLNKKLYGFLTDLEKEAIKPFSPAIELAANYAQKIGNAIGFTVEKGVQKLTGVESNIYEPQMDRVKAEGERLNKLIDPENKLMLSPTATTDLFASMALTFNVTNIKKLTALEGLMGYTMGVSDTKDISEGVKAGIYQGGAAAFGTLLVNKAIQAINTRGTKGALEYLWDKHSLELREAAGLGNNASKDEVINAIESDWLKIMQGSGSNETKVRALIDRLGERGAAYKMASQTMADIEKEVTIRQPKAERVSEIQKAVSEGDIGAAQAELAKQVGVGKKVAKETIDEKIASRGVSAKVGDRYRTMFENKIAKGEIASTYSDYTTAIAKKYTGELNVDTTSIDALKNSLSKRAELSKGLSSAETNLSEALSKPMTIDNLLSIKRSISKIAMKSEGDVLHNANILKGKVDDILKQTLSKDEFDLFKKLDVEYARRSAIVGKKDLNKIGIKLMEVANGKKELGSVLNELDTLNAGKTYFKDLEKIIGTDNVKKLEVGIVKNLTSGKVDDVSYALVNKSLDKLGFVTKEGQELKKIFKEYDNVFSADNFTTLNKKILNTSDKDVVALTADLIEKMKYSASSYLFKTIKRKFFNTKEAVEYRHLQDISKILSDKELYTRGLTLNGRKISGEEVQGIVRSSIINGYKEQIKNIEPNAVVNDAELEKTIDNTMGFKSSYGGKPTYPNKGNGGGDISQSLYGTKTPEPIKPIDKSGGLGMSQSYGSKATGTGGVNTKEASAKLNAFMDEIANPKVTVDTEKMDNLYNILKNEMAYMYAAGDAKKKAYAEAMAVMNKFRKASKVSPKDKETIIEAIKKYDSVLDDVKGKK